MTDDARKGKPGAEGGERPNRIPPPAFPPGSEAGGNSRPAGQGMDGAFISPDEPIPPRPRAGGSARAELHAAFVASAFSGIARGIQYLSNINVVLAFTLALFVVYRLRRVKPLSWRERLALAQKLQTRCTIFLRQTEIGDRRAHDPRALATARRTPGRGPLGRR